MKLSNFLDMDFDNICLIIIGLSCIVTGIIDVNNTTLEKTPIAIPIIIIGIVIMLSCFVLNYIHRLKKVNQQLEIRLSQQRIETDRYFTALAHTSNTPVFREVETEYDLPYVGVQNAIYYVTSQGRHLMWNGSRYIEAQFPSEEVIAHRRLQTARQRLEQWNQSMTDENWLHHYYTRAPEISSETINNMWQRHITTLFPSMEESSQACTEEKDDPIKDAPPAPVKESGNRLKNIFGGKHV